MPPAIPIRVTSPNGQAYYAMGGVPEACRYINAAGYSGFDDARSVTKRRHEWRGLNKAYDEIGRLLPFTTHGWQIEDVPKDEAQILKRRLPPISSIAWVPDGKDRKADSEPSAPIGNADAPDDAIRALKENGGEHLAEFMSGSHDLTPQHALDVYRAVLAAVSRMNIKIAAGTERPTGWDGKKIIETAREMCLSVGVDPQRAIDLRSDADKMYEAAERFVNAPSSFLTESEDTLKAIAKAFRQSKIDTKAYLENRLKAMTRADGIELEDGTTKRIDVRVDPNIVSMVRDKIKELATEKSGDGIRMPWEPEGPKALGPERAQAAWRVRRLAVMTRRVRRQLFAPAWHGATKTERFAWEAGFVIRLMAWVGQSTMSVRKDSDRVYSIGYPHVRAAVDLHLGHAKAAITKLGLLLPGDRVARKDGTEAKFAGSRTVGNILMLPPGHGKTTLLTYFALARVIKDRRLMIMYITKAEDVARDFLTPIRAAFDPTTGPGSRFAAANPGPVIQLCAWGNNQTSLRLAGPEQGPQANIECYTFEAERLSASANLMILDDVTNAADANSDTIRAKKKDLLARTWNTRLRGQNTQKIICGYPHHFDDVLWWQYNAAREAAETRGASGVPYIVTRIPVGGPASKPRFRSIWPERYPPRELKKRYQETRQSPEVWTSNYMLSPISESLRIIRKLEYFDDSSQEHADFCVKARVHVSVDPTGSTGRGTDRTGLVVVAVGGLVIPAMHEGMMVRRVHTVARVLHAEEFPATGRDVADRVVHVSRQFGAHECHIEEAGGWGDTVRVVLQERYGVRDITMHKPRNLSKTARLKACATLLEADVAERPPVQFAARPRGDGTQALEPGMKRLAEYIVDHQLTVGHHSLDALTQLVRHFAIDLSPLPTDTMMGRANTQQSIIKMMYDEAARRAADANNVQSMLSVVNEHTI